ncbi:MAG: bifunctional (p)ppGpp synthetase/guanosine-3',5'-bis(diphosphate) 3'-pyrophosphohydrolase [Oscillospiraceae bacterium]|nr:bifunctional (p)ppGpp synthetase/guanosine-3',5'-bis(diphosphate) 3'-pyrophosphohydrolase [Oscillospiraceae bacterium]
MSEDMTVELMFDELKEQARALYSAEEADVIEKAFKTANERHKGQKRSSGEPYIIHPIAVAKIVLDYGMDYQSVAAAMLHDTVEDTDLTLEDLKKEFGPEITALVDGLTKLGKVPLDIKDKEEQQAENVRKMLLAMSEDVRVIIIKLADRLHNVRTLNFVAPQKRRDKAVETLEIYAPIAHRLGIRAIKEELEDKAISYLDPIGYKEIEDNLATRGKSHKAFLESIKKQIEDRVHQVVPDAKLEGRIKSVHGIYRKMYMQNKSFDEIYDVYAVRIIVDTTIECYDCLGIIHDMFTPIPGRFKDYISTPKPNMYQSLHTTVLGKAGIPFEVQIRTWEMHHTAEYGIAAHWKYKLGINGTEKVEDRLTWIRQLLESQQETDDVKDIVRTIKSDFVPEEVFVFTPKGDVINLPVDSTVIDFAYAIHSAVGNKMVGAKVAGKIVPLDYKVQTGDIVEVMTSSQQGKGPSRDWLKIVKTSSAKTKIRSWFKKECREENIVEGRTELEKEIRRNKFRFTEEEYKELVETLAERQHCATADDFYAAIGYGGIPVTRVLPFIRDEYHRLSTSHQPKEIKITEESKKHKHSVGEGVTVDGVDGCLIKLSRCCAPIPGDEIIGFITRGHGVSIHKRDCPNVPKDIVNCEEPDRWINARWLTAGADREFKASLAILCENRVALMADVAALLAGLKVNINAINTRETKEGNVLIFLTITVKSADFLNVAISKIKSISGVINVTRGSS